MPAYVYNITARRYINIRTFIIVYIIYIIIIYKLLLYLRIIAFRSMYNGLKGENIIPSAKSMINIFIKL